VDSFAQPAHLGQPFFEDKKLNTVVFQNPCSGHPISIFVLLLFVHFSGILE
jgi:hypothetical protein